MQRLYNRKTQSAALILLILLIVVPYLCTTFYAFPFADDYAMYLERVDYLKQTGQADTVFSSIAQTPYSTCTYGHGFGHVWNSLLSPMKSGSLVPVRVYLLLYILFFVAAIITFSSVVVHRFFKLKRFSLQTLFLSAMLVLLFFGMRFYPEIYAWFTTAEFYLFPLSMALFAGALLLEHVFAPRWYKWVLACIAAVSAGCGPINVGTFSCFLFLLIGGYGLFVQKRNIAVLAPLALTAALTLLYILMPGASHRMDGRTLDVMGSFYYAAHHLGLRLGKLMIRSWFPAVLVFFGLFAWNHFQFDGKSKFWNHPILMLLAVGAVCYTVTYPVALGYAAYFPNRSEFVTDASIYLTSLYYVYYLVHFLRRRKGECKPATRKLWAAAACVFLIASALFITPITEQPVVAVYQELLSGKLASNEAYWHTYLDSLQQKQGMAVQVPLPDDLTSQFVLYQQILPDPEYWVNVAMARYYGVKSIQQDVHCGQVYIRNHP
ncbi:MAG: DUF6056 family protein [Candidatus Limiplasma sp.]|nr:DUF6056 family protein [Candidatus Limiplasma sp.]